MTRTITNSVSDHTAWWLTKGGRIGRHISWWQHVSLRPLFVALFAKVLFPLFSFLRKYKLLEINTKKRIFNSFFIFQWRQYQKKVASKYAILEYPVGVLFLGLKKIFGQNWGNGYKLYNVTLMELHDWFYIYIY